jgi:hypothetical protein
VERGDKRGQCGGWIWSKYIIFMHDNVVMKLIILYNWYVVISKWKPRRTLLGSRTWHLCLYLIGQNLVTWFI